MTVTQTILPVAWYDAAEKQIELRFIIPSQATTGL